MRVCMAIRSSCPIDDRRAPLFQRRVLLSGRPSEPDREEVASGTDEDGLAFVSAGTERALIVVHDPPVRAVAVAFFVDRAQPSRMVDPSLRKDALTVPRSV